MGMRLRITLDSKPFEAALTQYIAAVEALTDVTLDLKVEWVDDGGEDISPELAAVLKEINVKAQLVRDETDEDDCEQ